MTLHLLMALYVVPAILVAAYPQSCYDIEDALISKSTSSPSREAGVNLRLSSNASFESDPVLRNDLRSRSLRQARSSLGPHRQNSASSSDASLSSLDLDFLNEPGFRSDDELSPLQPMQLEMHEVGTTHNRNIHVIGVDGCAALFLFGTTADGGNFVTAAHITVGRDRRTGLHDMQIVDKAVREASQTGHVSRITIASADEPYVRDFPTLVLDTIKSSYKTNAQYKPHPKVLVQVMYYPWSIDTGQDWNFLAVQHVGTVQAIKVVGSQEVPVNLNSSTAEVALIEEE